MVDASNTTLAPTQRSPLSSRMGLSSTPTSNGSHRRSFIDSPLSGRESGDCDVGIVAKAAEKGLPNTPREDRRNQAPGIPDRRRTQRPNSVRRVDGDGGVRRGQGARGLGPKLPVKVSPANSPSPSRTPTMADVRSRMRAQEDDMDSSDAFEDAAESVSSQLSRTPSRNTDVDKSEEQNIAGLGINGGVAPGSTQSIVEEDEAEGNGDLKPKMSARLSRWAGDEAAMFVNDEDDDSMNKHSRNKTAERVPAIVAESTEGEQQEQRRTISPEALSAQSSRPISAISNLSTEAAVGRTLEQELDTDSSVPISPVDNDQTPKLPAHSRQNTTETAPALAAHSTSSVQSISMDASPTRPSEPADALPEHSLSLSGIRAGLADHSRQNTAESIPSLTLQPSDANGERSISPSHPFPREESPVRTVHGLSGDVSVSSSPPPSSAGRLRALESRQLGDRPSSTSPQPGGLMRSASTRMGAFLGRMGTIRKPGKSPPAPRQDRFNVERRNTAASIASVKGAGNESLTTISDAPEGEESRKKVRSSLQDRFQTLRQQEESGVSGSNEYFFDGDEEQTPIARKVSDVGPMSPGSPTKESPESRSQRAASTPSILRSPPMNPSLPPGTASGLTAGPAEEPQPVDWDLWQAVVYEGPSAVTKTSGEELNRAIASGIPAAIRGVVWQVLAESKNDELENIYRTLKARGTADEDHLAPNVQRPGPGSRKSSQNNVNGVTENGEKESQVSSSRSSIHSAPSTPPTTVASPPPSVQEEESDLKSKLLAEKQKREATALVKLEKAIKRDMGTRTSYSKFVQAEGLQDGLFGVCKAYALFDDGVGYAQGINFIAMPLLFNMAEEEAFTLLVRLMSKYDLRSMFTGDLAGLHLRLYQFERVLEDLDPPLYCHLRRRSVGPQLYATQWFLTLFAYRFPLQLVLRIYDLIFSEGLTAIMKFGLVLMQRNRDTLLGMKDMGHLTTFLKEKLFDVYIDKSPSASSLLDSGFFGSVTGGADKELYRADEMVRDACAITITDATLAQYTAEWEESQRQTQVRDSELEDLRAAHNALSVKVKVLEERTQEQDTEHVSIAGDLVRIKVTNDDLQDENEGLKVKVEELQKLVDSQPAEIEATLQEEMNRIVQRNSEVQGENRVLREEMEEMEQELVNAKVQRAQTQSEYDALIQKWANVQAMLTDK